MKGVFLIAVLLAVLSQCVFSDDTLDYGIMIDAGSSGSRIYLYQWPHRDDPSLPLVESTIIDQTVVSMKINTPLASFASNVSYAGNSLDPLIAYIKKNLDSSRYSDTPIYLKATAGMRAISEADQNAIIANVRVYLANTPFDFKPEYAQVIPGSAEGVYGWITVNYLLEILQSANPSTSGALDMGGASTQITFVPTTAPKQYNFSSVFSSRLYNLYSYSYPLGQDQSNRLILAGLFTDKIMNINGNVMNPCYLQGYSEQDTINGVTVIGTSNYTDCAAAVLKYIVKPDAGCIECGMDSVYQPPVVGSFYAFSGFAYTFQFFGLSSTATIGQLRAKAQEFCSYNYTQAQAAYPNGDSFLKSYCFTSSYFVQALTQYGFADTTNSITFTSSVGSTEVTWALGGMIYEANLLPIDNIPTTTTTGNSTTSTSSTTSGSTTSSASSVSFCFVSSFVLFLVLFSLVL